MLEFSTQVGAHLEPHLASPRPTRLLALTRRYTRRACRAPPNDTVRAARDHVDLPFLGGYSDLPRRDWMAWMTCQTKFVHSVEAFHDFTHSCRLVVCGALLLRPGAKTTVAGGGHSRRARCTSLSSSRGAASEGRAFRSANPQNTTKNDGGISVVRHPTLEPHTPFLTSDAGATAGGSRGGA